MPVLELHNHQNHLEVDLAALQERACQALPLVLERPGLGPAVLPALETVEVSLIPDDVICRVHGQFLDDPSPTDVITFDHGEILISSETAVRQAAEHGQLPERELTLYLIHGLLHLHGHEDQTEAGYAAMCRMQEEILQAVWPAPEANRIS